LCRNEVVLGGGKDGIGASKVGERRRKVAEEFKGGAQEAGRSEKQEPGAEGEHQSDGRRNLKAA